MIVKCISNLGQTFEALLIDPDVAVDESILAFGKLCAGINQYALVYDYEYDYLIIRKWGYDVFTLEDYDKR